MFSEKVISYNRNLDFNKDLPAGIRIMNPFKESSQALTISSAFYRKFYSDNKMRHLILGINPGRFGAGVTGVPFTDTKRLKEHCGLEIEGLTTHEPSSVFIYEVIETYGGVEAFYSDFYINSPSPLGFVKTTQNGKEINFNYYDSPELLALLKDYIIESIKAHISMGIITDVAFCLGTGKNYKYLNKLNEEYHFFELIIPLEHPRYIIQYKSNKKKQYINKYIKALKTPASLHRI